MGWLVIVQDIEALAPTVLAMIQAIAALFNKPTPAPTPSPAPAPAADAQPLQIRVAKVGDVFHVSIG